MRLSLENAPRGKHARAHAPRHGAALVDLVITVLVIGILSAVAMPRFASAVARLRTEAVAKRVASDLNYARRNAIQTSRLATVTFRASPAGYDFTGVANPARPSQNYSVNLADLDSGVVLSSFSFDGGATFSFNNYGRPLVGTAPLASGTIRVASGEHSFNVTINASTGEATTQ